MECILCLGKKEGVKVEHFNDLLRKKASGKQLIVINPEIDDLTKKVCGLLGKAENVLNNVAKAGFQGRACNGLLFLKARAEELTADKMKSIIN